MAFFQSVQEQIEQRTPDDKRKAPVHLYMLITAAMKADGEYRNGQPPPPAVDLSNEPYGHLFDGANFLHEQVSILLELMKQADNEYPISDINAIFATDYAPGAIGTILDRVVSILRPTKATIVEEPGQSLLDLHEQGRNSEIFKMFNTLSSLFDTYFWMDTKQRTYLDWTIEDGNAQIAYFVKNRRPKNKGSMEDD